MLKGKRKILYSGLNITISNAFFLRTDDSATEAGVEPDIELEFEGENDLKQVLEIIKADLNK